MAHAPSSVGFSPRVAIITQTAVIDAPTISTFNSIVLGLITQTATISDIEVGHIALDLINQTAVLHDMVLSTVGEQFFSAPLIDQTAVISAAIVSGPHRVYQAPVEITVAPIPAARIYQEPVEVVVGPITEGDQLIFII